MHAPYQTQSSRPRVRSADPRPGQPRPPNLAAPPPLQPRISAASLVLGGRTSVGLKVRPSGGDAKASPPRPPLPCLRRKQGLGGAPSRGSYAARSCPPGGALACIGPYRSPPGPPARLRRSEDRPRISKTRRGLAARDLAMGAPPPRGAPSEGGCPAGRPAGAGAALKGGPGKGGGR